MPTTDTTVGRLQLAHPDIGHDGGAGLHAKVRSAWTKLGDNINARFQTVDALADTASQDFAHNFKCSIDELSLILYLRNTGTGELTRIDSASTPSINDFDISATAGSETTSVTVTNNSGSDQDLALVTIHNGGASAGGGGGSALSWDQPDTVYVPAQKGYFAGLAEGFIFSTDDSDQSLIAVLVVPKSYQPGKQVKLFCPLISSDTSGNMKFQTTTYLVENATDGITDTTDSHTSTPAEISIPATANVLHNTEFGLTDTTGKINGVSIAAGDLLVVRLQRDFNNETTSATGKCGVLKSTTEVSFNG